VMKGIKVGLDILRNQQERRPASEAAAEEDEELFI
jgi:hypothetical protein